MHGRLRAQPGRDPRAAKKGLNRPFSIRLLCTLILLGLVVGVRQTLLQLSHAPEAPNKSLTSSLAIDWISEWCVTGNFVPCMTHALYDSLYDSFPV